MSGRCTLPDKMTHLHTEPNASTRIRGLFYGWKLVGLTLLVTALAGGPVWNGVGVWVLSLIHI